MSVASNSRSPFVTAEAKEIIIIGYSGLDKHLNKF